MTDDNDIQDFSGTRWPHHTQCACNPGCLSCSPSCRRSGPTFHNREAIMAKTKKAQTVKRERKKANGKGKEPKQRKTAEVLSDEQRKTLLFNHLGKIKPLLVKETEAKADVNRAFELAAKEGVTKKEIKLAIAFETEDGNEEATADVERIMRVARWSGAKLGTQLEMFGKPEKGVDPVYEEGKRAAMKDEARKPPAHHHDKAAQRWLAGFDEGRQALNATRAQGFRPLGEAVADLAEKAGIAASLGTEPPTHVEVH